MQAACGRSSPVVGGHPRWRVEKRNGEQQPFDLMKVHERIAKLVQEGPELEDVNIDYVVQGVIARMRDGVRTRELDEVAVEVCRRRMLLERDYENLAVRLLETSIRKDAPASYTAMLARTDRLPYRRTPFFRYEVDTPGYLEWARAHAPELDAILGRQAGSSWDYPLSGLQVLAAKYLRTQDDPKQPYLENVDTFWLRVAAYVFYPDLAKVEAAAEAMMRGRATFATPTLANSGRNMSSCFLQRTPVDSMRSIMMTLLRAGMQSKGGGGVGIADDLLRGAGETVAGTSGHTSGVQAWAKLKEDVAAKVDQGGNKRKGTFAAYLADWHQDVLAMIRMGSPSTDAQIRTNRLNYGFWVSDVWLRRFVGEDPATHWTFFDPAGARRVFETPEALRLLPPDVQAIVEGMRDLMCRPGPGHEADPPYRAPVELGYFAGMDFARVYVALEQLSEARPDVLWSRRVPISEMANELRELAVTMGRVYFQRKDEHARTVLSNWGPALGGSNICTEMSLPSGLLPFRWLCAAADEMVRIACCPDDPRHAQQRDLLTRNEEDLPDAWLAQRYDSDPAALIMEALRRAPVATAVCNLASLSLSAYVRRVHSGPGLREAPDWDDSWVDWRQLASDVVLMTEGLVRVARATRCPDLSSYVGNLLMQSIGLGVSGWHDMLAMLGVPFDSPLAEQLNRDVYYAMYYHSEAACADLVPRYGAYPMFPGSPLSEGTLAIDLHRDGRRNAEAAVDWLADGGPGAFDWAGLAARVKAGSVASMKTTIMPTATTATIRGRSRATEPIPYTVFTSQTNLGEFHIVPPSLRTVMEARGEWPAPDRVEAFVLAMKERRGSVQGLDAWCSKATQRLFRTIHETSKKVLARLNAGRGGAMSNAQAHNVYFARGRLTHDVLNAVWRDVYTMGLTGTYYVSAETGTDVVTFQVQPTAAPGTAAAEEPPAAAAERKALAPAPSPAADDCTDFCGT